MEPILLPLNETDLTAACRMYAIAKMNADPARYRGPARMTYNATGGQLVVAIAVWPTQDEAEQPKQPPPEQAGT